MVQLPPPVVGWVIGKGGSRIKEMMTASNCRMYVRACVPVRMMIVLGDDGFFFIHICDVSRVCVYTRLVLIPTYIHTYTRRWVDQDVGPEEPRKLHLMGNKQQVEAALRMVNELLRTAPILQVGLGVGRVWVGCGVLCMFTCKDVRRCWTPRVGRRVR